MQTLAHACNTPGRIPSRVCAYCLKRLRCRRAAELVLFFPPLIAQPFIPSPSYHFSRPPAASVGATCRCLASDAANALVDGHSELGLRCNHILQSSACLNGVVSSLLRGVLSCESTKKSENRHASLCAASQLTRVMRPGQFLYHR